MTTVPAASMNGMVLADGWKVTGPAPKKPSSTGGCFSYGYFVEHESGRKGFLKALDFSRALRSGNVLSELKKATDAFSHEQMILAACKSFKMTRVVHAIADGQALVDPLSPIGEVPYFIFDLADGDIRGALDLSGKVDVAWALRTLHQISVGLLQLHSKQMAHQDLKPSNVLTFSDYGSRVADLGCASVEGRGGPRDSLNFAGDPSYAPPEHLYGYLLPEWSDRRMAGDAFLFASMIVFLFSKASICQMLFTRLSEAHRPPTWNGKYAGTFEEILPYLNNAFDEVIRLFESDCSGAFSGDLTRIVRELGNPDPNRRGSAANRSANTHPCNLERYVSELNLLASRAELGLSGRS